MGQKLDISNMDMGVGLWDGSRLRAPAWLADLAAKAGGVHPKLGVAFDLDQGWVNGSLVSIPALLSCARVQTVPSYYTKADGSLQQFAQNALRYGDNGLLVEEQRTNLCPNSQAISTPATWTTVSAIAGNSAVAPDGTTTADTLTLAGTTDSLFAQDIGVVASSAYSFSFHAKKGTANGPMFAFRDQTGAAFIAFNLAMTGLNTSTWTRIVSALSTPAGCLALRPYLLRNSSSSGSLFFWGVSLELGAFATSYIPTTSAAVTRPADVVTGLPAISGDFTDYVQLGDAQGSAVVLGGGANTTLIERVNSTQVKATDGTTTATATVGSGNTSACKIAVARQGNAIKLCANAGAIASATLGAIDVSANQYGKKGGGSVAGLSLMKKHVRFGAFLADAALQALTT